MSRRNTVTNYVTGEQIFNIFILFYLKGGDKLVKSIRKNYTKQFVGGTKIGVASKVRDRYHKTFE